MALPKVADLYSARRPKNQVLYSDFLVNFNAHPDNEQLMINYNEEAVLRSIKNLLFTNKYERLFQPALGSNLKSLLFEPITPQTETNIVDQIRETIENHEPRANIIDLVATGYPDQNAYMVTLTFYVTSMQNALTVNIPLIRVR